MSRVNSPAAVCHRGPVTRWSCVHCPVYRCYETALGAAAQTGTEAAPSRVYGAPTSLCQSAAEEQHVCQGGPEVRAGAAALTSAISALGQGTSGGGFHGGFHHILHYYHFRLEKCLIESQNSNK